MTTIEMDVMEAQCIQSALQPPDFQLYRKVWEAIIPEIGELLNGNILELQKTLLSLRRVNNVLYGSTSISSPNNSGGVFDKAREIHDDCIAVGQAHTSTKEVFENLKRIGSIEIALFPLAMAKATISNRKGARFVDQGELEAQAQETIEELVWLRWKIMPELTEIENATNLFNYALASLASLNQRTEKEMYGPKTIRTTTYNLDEAEERLIASERIELERPNQIKDLLEDWHMRAHKYGIKQILSIIVSLPQRERLAVLDRFGYLYPELKMEQRAEIYGISLLALRTAFIRGMVRLTNRIDEQPIIPTTNDISIADTIKQLRQPLIVKQNGEAVKFDSPRLALLTIDREVIWTRLTDSERRVFELASQYEENNITYSLEEISTLTGLDTRTITGLIKKVVEVSKEKEPGYIDSKGKRIVMGTAQYELIKAYNGIPLESRACLSLRESQIFEFVGTTNAQGRYPTTTEIKERFKTKSAHIIEEIQESLNSTEWLSDLNHELAFALINFREYLNQNEIQVITYVLECIKSGIPLRSASRRTIGWQHISYRLGIHKYFGRNLMRKIEELKEKKSQRV